MAGDHQISGDLVNIVKMLIAALAPFVPRIGVRGIPRAFPDSGYLAVHPLSFGHFPRERGEISVLLLSLRGG